MDDFKYLAIVDWVKEKIRQDKLLSGDRFYSENELCDMHNVSRQTVRHALDMLERQNVLRRKRGSGTFIQSSDIDTHKNNSMVGVISTYFSDYIFPSIITGMERVLVKSNAGIQLAITHNQVAEETRALRTMLAQNVGGIILEPSKSALPNPNVELYKEISSRNIPLVFFNAKYPWIDAPCVCMDDIEAGRLVTEHLISLGHKRITGIFTSDDIQGHKRYQGFLRSFEDHGLHVPEDRVVWYSTRELPTLFTMSRDRILPLISDSTAVVCYNDKLAVDFLEFCKKNGYAVPEDISVVGIDDSKLSNICEIPLTTARHPHEKLGREAANSIIDMMANPALKAEDKIFTPKLIVRKSTKKIEKSENLS